jgi:hypothetical protein
LLNYIAIPLLKISSYRGEDCLSSIRTGSIKEFILRLDFQSFFTESNQFTTEESATTTATSISLDDVAVPLL